MSGWSLNVMLKLNEKLPVAVRLNAKLARQRRRSRWNVSWWKENWRVAMSNCVLQLAVQLRVGVNDMFIAAVRRPGWFFCCAVVSKRLRELDNETPSVKPRPPAPSIPAPVPRGEYGIRVFSEYRRKLPACCATGSRASAACSA